MFLTTNYIFFDFVFFFDLVSLVSGGILILVRGVILIYSKDYFNAEIFNFKFFLCIFFFGFFIIILFFSFSPFRLVLRWEGVGLISFILISWWSGRQKALGSSLLAIASNRVRDFRILFFICSLTDGTILVQALILRIVAKSAQLSFHFWLPQAMEGPTPVSSLLHSSTIVIARVYVYIRFFDLFSYPSIKFLFIIRGLTMIYGGLWSRLHFDVKKVIAYSTLSQLGFIFFICSLYRPILTLLIILLHSFFKSLLFMSSRIFIHSSGGSQSVVSLKFSFISNPLTSIFFIFSALSLLGFPFFSRYFSKHLGVEFFTFSWANSLSVIFLIIRSSLTVFYCISLLSTIFSSKNVHIVSFEDLYSYKWGLLNLLILCFLGSMITKFFLGGIITSGLVFFYIPFLVYLVRIRLSFCSVSFFLDKLSYENLVLGTLLKKSKKLFYTISQFDNFFWDFFFVVVVKIRSFFLLPIKFVFIFCFLIVLFFVFSNIF